MTYEDFLKTFIEKNKSLVERDELFGGYDIQKYDKDKLTDECYEFIKSKMNDVFSKPDINSDEYHDYYKTMLLIKCFCAGFEKYNRIMWLPKPPSTEVYHGQRD